MSLHQRNIQRKVHFFPLAGWCTASQRCIGVVRGEHNVRSPWAGDICHPPPVNAGIAAKRKKGCDNRGAKA